MSSSSEDNDWFFRGQNRPKQTQMKPKKNLGPGYTDTFTLKTQRFLCGFISCSHGNDENDHKENANIWIRNPKWVDLKKQQNDNGTIWKRIRVTEALKDWTKVDNKEVNSVAACLGTNKFLSRPVLSLSLV